MAVLSDALGTRSRLNSLRKLEFPQHRAACVGVLWPTSAFARSHLSGLPRIGGLLGDQYDFDARCKTVATGEGFAGSRALMPSFAPATGRLMAGGGPPSSAGRLMAA